ncbi:MAG: type II secretion system F family protein [Planctomycetales bacterium]|nr:type II secretion system F family protein [Planctomycetales bacterium]
MAKFKYQARNAEGKKLAGTMAAQNEQAAIGELRKQNLVVLSVQEEGGGAGGGGGGFFKSLTGKRAPRPRVRSEDLVIFTRQLATMISAGIPLLESLEILTEQVDDKGFQYVLHDVVDNVRSGMDLSASLGQHPKVFAKIYVNMIRAGEASGQLDEILVRLAEYQEATAALRREIVSAMTYPVVSLCLVFGITGFLLIYIVPKFKEIFDSFTGLELPIITKMLLTLSYFLKDNFLILGGALVGVGVLFFLYKRTDRGEWQLDWVKLQMPIFGPLFRKVAISRFARTFATLIQSGVPILGALEIVAATAGNRIIEDAVNAARENVRQGETLGEPLAKSKVFPPMVTRMITIGERSGALEKLLQKIAEFYDQQVKATVEGLTALIEPLMIGVMGFIVGGIVLAIFLPIFKLQAKLQSGG